MADLVPINHKENNGLSNDINKITSEIYSFYHGIGNSILKIGKRLKHVKENVLSHGEYGTWVTETLGLHPTTASRYVAAYEQFGNLATSLKFDSSKVFEMLSLPASIDRQQFIEKEHVIPSSGEAKSVEDMTVKELREVKKSIREEEKKKQAKQQNPEGSDKKDHHAQNDITELTEDKENLPEIIQPSITLENATTVIEPDEIASAVNDLTEDVQTLVEKYQYLCNSLPNLKEMNDGTRKALDDAAETLRIFISYFEDKNHPPIQNNFASENAHQASH